MSLPAPCSGGRDIVCGMTPCYVRIEVCLWFWHSHDNQRWYVDNSISNLLAEVGSNPSTKCLWIGNGKQSQKFGRKCMVLKEVNSNMTVMRVCCYKFAPSSSFNNCLFFSLILVTSGNLVVFQFIRILWGCNHTQVITKLLLLEVALG